MATESRKKANQMEQSRMAPATTRNKAMSGALKGPNMMAGPSEIYDFVRSKVSPRTPRSEEEMSELAREVERAEVPRRRPFNADATMSPVMREAWLNAQDEMARKKMGEAYDRAMPDPYGKAKGGSIKGYAKGGKIDGCAKRGKTKGRIV